MAEVNAKRKSRRAVPAHSWQVFMRRSSAENPDTGAANNVIPFKYGVDEVSGLDMGTINIIESRSSGHSNPYKQLHVGLMSTGEVVMRGIYSYSMEDLRGIMDWHKECLGDRGKLVDHVDRYRDIYLSPAIMGKDSRNMTAETDANVGVISLKSCLIVNVAFSDLTQTSSDPHQWILTIRPTKVSYDGGE